MSKLKKGDYVYYRWGLDSIPAIILKECKKTFLIRGDFLSGSKKRYIKKSNLILQEKD